MQAITSQLGFTPTKKLHYTMKHDDQTKIKKPKPKLKINEAHAHAFKTITKSILTMHIREED